MAEHGGSAAAHCRIGIQRAVFGKTTPYLEHSCRDVARACVFATARGGRQRTGIDAERAGAALAVSFSRGRTAKNIMAIPGNRLAYTMTL